jgi:hypothetical protein
MDNIVNEFKLYYILYFYYLQAMAEVMERWQLLEMEHGSERIIARLAGLVIKDSKFYNALCKGVLKKKDWLRDMAGVLFRFWGLIHEGSLQLSAEYSGIIGAAIETILNPLESNPPVALAGHYYGALYMQVLVPWLCAWNSGQPSAQLRLLVIRVAHAVVNCYKTHKSTTLKREVRERMHIEYLQVSQEPIWGAKKDDIIQKTFY